MSNKSKYQNFRALQQKYVADLAAQVPMNILDSFIRQELSCYSIPDVEVAICIIRAKISMTSQPTRNEIRKFCSEYAAKHEC